MNALRKLIVVTALLGAWQGTGAAAAAARGPISPRNPYRSFNISGINYGSMQWEREHRGRGGSAHHAGRGWLGRRR
jgi:hypothetical protein